MLRAHLATLAQLATVAVGLVAAVGQSSLKPDRHAAGPMAAVGAFEKALRRQAKVSWALRLIAALRAKLTSDLQRVEQGESLDVIFAVEGPEAAGPTELQSPIKAEADPAPQAERRENLRPERERRETESFGRLLGRRVDDEFAEILKRPTEEVIALIREALGVDDAEAAPGPPADGWEPGRPFCGPAPRALRLDATSAELISRALNRFSCSAWEGAGANPFPPGGGKGRDWGGS